MTLVDIARERAATTPERRAFTFLRDGDVDEVHLTYKALDERASAVAAALQEHRARGERALLLYPPGLDFIGAFLGCLYGQTIAVPAYLPPPAYLERALSKLLSIVSDARPTVGLTTSALRPSIEAALAHDADGRRLRWVATDALPDKVGNDGPHSAPGSGDLAFLQYTSGSTAAPKGVAVSHANLMANSAAIQRCFGSSPQSQGVCWLPLYHDMGLIGSVVQPIYAGFPTTLMSPLAFLQRPIRWLKAVTRFKATISGGPNFAYDLCVAKISDELRRGLDLSSWDVAVTGAEPVRAATLARFASAFEPCGFERRAFFASYGLAESTLMVTGGDRTAPPVLLDVEVSALERGEAVVAGPAERDTRTLVGCGKTQPDHRVAIVRPDTRTECTPQHIGEIWVQGPSVASGYWNRPVETEEVFGAHVADTGEGRFLRTGDLGFFREGEIFVTGRLKDLIIISGRNHYPQDIEETVQRSHPAVWGGCVAAFSDDVDGEERLVVLVELDGRATIDLPDGGGKGPIDPTSSSALQPILAAIRRTVAESHDVPVHDVVLLRAGSIPKTSSGKIQRHACRAAFRAGAWSPLKV